MSGNHSPSHLPMFKFILSRNKLPTIHHVSKMQINIQHATSLLKCESSSVVPGRDAVLDLADELDAHLGDVVALERVLHEPDGDLDVHHLEGAPHRARQDVGVPQVVAVVRQLHELGHRVRVEDERELVRGAEG